MRIILTDRQLLKANDAAIAQNISSADLMERAGKAFFDVYFKRGKGSVAVICGPGNNGGDGFVIARLLSEAGYLVTVYRTLFSGSPSPDNVLNLERIKGMGLTIVDIAEPDQVKELDSDRIIEAIFGSGLNRPLTGSFAKLVENINALNKEVCSVDVPAGMPAEGNFNGGPAIFADKVITFHQPRLGFYFPESGLFVKDFEAVDIGLDEQFTRCQESFWKLTEETDIASILRPRKRFSHKGNYGHALIVAGSEQTMGAALLAAKACVYGGAGLTTACIPQSGLTAMNVSMPEVMYLSQDSSAIRDKAGKFNAVAFGPGTSTSGEAGIILKMLPELKVPLVIDADGITILASNKELMKKLPENSVLTPHMKEFDRLFGDHSNWWARVETARSQAIENKCVIVLKNQYTFIAMPSGDVVINHTGNPAMASGGMGDVLTGLITAFIAQGYSSADAAVLSCYLHGMAGDELSRIRSTVTASEVSVKIPEIIAFLTMDTGKF